MWSWWRFQESRAARGFGRSVTVSGPLLWSERETLLKRKPSHGWMGCSLTKFSSRQPLLNKYGTVWWGPKGITFTDIYLFPVSADLFFSPYLSSLTWDPYIRLTFLVFHFPQVPLLSVFFPPPSLIFVAFFHQCTYQFLPPEGFNGFLCAVSRQSDPSSDKYSFQRPFTGNEPIGGFSSRSLLAGNLTCETRVSVRLPVLAVHRSTI